MSTPHNFAHPGDFAKTVLMPGDPLRAKHIAERFLGDAKLINNARGIQSYTGTWKGVPVSVMASGMGMPSIGIYSWELYEHYNVENIIRIGSAGGFAEEINLMDIVFAMGASTDSNYGKSFKIPGTYAAMANYDLLSAAVDLAKEKQVPFHVGNILSSDHFYSPFLVEDIDAWIKMGVLATEMESAALYMNAAYFHKRALTICTISDHLIRKEHLSIEDRQTGFKQMMEIALDTAVKMDSI